MNCNYKFEICHGCESDDIGMCLYTGINNENLAIFTLSYEEIMSTHPELTNIYNENEHPTIDLFHARKYLNEKIQLVENLQVQNSIELVDIIFKNTSQLLANEQKKIKYEENEDLNLHVVKVNHKTLTSNVKFFKNNLYIIETYFSNIENLRKILIDFLKKTLEHVELYHNLCYLE